MESLEQKIEQTSKEPQKKPAAKKAPAIKVFYICYIIVFFPLSQFIR